MKRWLRVVGAFALVAASGVEARAQMGVARGEVVDENGAPVAGATVELDFLGELDRQYTTETDDKGQYTQVVGSGRYRVTVSKDGYRGSRGDQAVRTGPPTEIPPFTIVSRESLVQAAMAPVLKKFEKASELSKAGSLDEAVAVYLELKAEHPDIPELYFNLGTIYLRQEKWLEAEAAYQRALELLPENTKVRVLLADIHKNLGRSDEALAAMETLVAENPDDPQLHYNLGVFYLNAQRYEDAFASFDETRKRDPDNVDVLYLLGTLSVSLGQIDQAVGHLQSYLEKAPENGQHRTTASELISKLQPAEPSSQ